MSTKRQKCVIKNNQIWYIFCSPLRCQSSVTIPKQCNSNIKSYPSDPLWAKNRLVSTCVMSPFHLHHYNRRVFSRIASMTLLQCQIIVSCVRIWKHIWSLSSPSSIRMRVYRFMIISQLVTIYRSRLSIRKTQFSRVITMSASHRSQLSTGQVPQHSRTEANITMYQS